MFKDISGDWAYVDRWDVKHSDDTWYEADEEVRKIVPDGLWVDTSIYTRFALKVWEHMECNVVTLVGICPVSTGSAGRSMFELRTVIGNKHGQGATGALLEHGILSEQAAEKWFVNTTFKLKIA